MWIQQYFMCFYFFNSQTMPAWGQWIRNRRKQCLKATSRPLAELQTRIWNRKKKKRKERKNKKQVVFFSWEKSTLGMFCRNHFRWDYLQGNQGTQRKGETDLWGYRGSWAWSPDLGDPVSQVGAGSSPGARSMTVRVTLAWLRTGDCIQVQHNTPQQLTAPHTGGHLDVEIETKLQMKCE